VQMPLTSGPRGWPAGQSSWMAGPTLQPLTGWLRGDTLQEAVEGNPKLKVGFFQTPWPAGHVARQAGHYLVCYRLNQVSKPFLDPYKYPLLVEIKATYSTCSSPHVKIQFSSSSTGKALSRVKSQESSRVEHSLELQM
jgi:hypothetical protein